jgi:hypothetical protein
MIKTDQTIPQNGENLKMSVADTPFEFVKVSYITRIGNQ